mmetsp:Transcript_102448/g.298796  ORF Transcript_102448/g.298796 Transcript_102448/m.298796 type:complete len:212 (-) Transcript_102448:294-929(-)
MCLGMGGGSFTSSAAFFRSAISSSSLSLWDCWLRLATPATYAGGDFQPKGVLPVSVVDWRLSARSSASSFERQLVSASTLAASPLITSASVPRGTTQGTQSSVCSPPFTGCGLGTCGGSLRRGAAAFSVAAPGRAAWSDSCMPGILRAEFDWGKPPQIWSLPGMGGSSCESTLGLDAPNGFVWPSIACIQAVRACWPRASGCGIRARGCRS